MSLPLQGHREALVMNAQAREDSGVSGIASKQDEQGFKGATGMEPNPKRHRRSGHRLWVGKEQALARGTQGRRRGETGVLLQPVKCP